ncbi:hypothetical protein TNCV_4970121 [Trichonephila clavipes]|nr:hypothetical protein TNCV_4970121 [Trichonephila clavipes]
MLLKLYIQFMKTLASSCLCRQRGRRACDDLQRERAWGQREGRMARRQHQLELEATGTEEGPSYGSGIDDTIRPLCVNYGLGTSSRPFEEFTFNQLAKNFTSHV